MSDVFISYSRKDSEFVRTFNKALENSKCETWVDWEGIEPKTKRWQEIERANTFIFLISPDSVASPDCQEDINYAVECKKRILPIIYRDADKFLDSSNSAHKQLIRHRRLDFQKTDNNNFQQSFQALIKALNNPVPDVFISYSRKDREFVKTLYNALEESNFKTWIDWDGIAKGTDWLKEIQRGIEESDVFVFVISPDSIKSDECEKEIQYALESHKKILPIVYRDAITFFDANKNSHQEIKKINWIFFEETNNFEKAFKELIQAIDLDHEYAHQHKLLSLKALEWERNGKKDSNLLRAENITNAEKWRNIGISKEPKPTELQKDFITRSREAFDAQVERDKLQIVILRALLGVASVALVTAVGGIIFALNMAKQAELVVIR